MQLPIVKLPAGISAMLGCVKAISAMATTHPKGLRHRLGCIMASGVEIVSPAGGAAIVKALFLYGLNNPFCRCDAETSGDGVVRLGSTWRCFQGGFVGALLALWGGFGVATAWLSTRFEVALMSHWGGFD